MCGAEKERKSFLFSLVVFDGGGNRASKHRPRPPPPPPHFSSSFAGRKLLTFGSCSSSSPFSPPPPPFLGMGREIRREGGREVFEAPTTKHEPSFLLLLPLLPTQKSFSALSLLTCFSPSFVQRGRGEISPVPFLLLLLLLLLLRIRSREGRKGSLYPVRSLLHYRQKRWRRRKRRAGEGLLLLPLSLLPSPTY